MDNSTTFVLLIRHGENDWVGENRLAGRTPDVHLNEKGRKQSQRIAKMLAEHPISAVYSSPMERCIETAEPTAAAHGLELMPEPGILEVDYGGWQGGSIKELAKTPEWQLVQHAPSTFRFPEGETLFEVQMRAVNTLQRIQERHPDQLVTVFSHGDVIRTAVAHYLGTPIDLFQRVVIGTGSISAIAFHGPAARVLFTNYQSELPKFEFKQDEDEDNAAEEKAENAPEQQEKQ